MPEQTASLDTALDNANRLLATDPALAGDQAREILKVVPNQPMALLLLGQSYGALGALDRATEVLESLASAHPTWALAQLELGRVLGRVGRNDESMTALRRAVALTPDLPQAWREIGDRLTAIGDRAGADAAYANHVRHWMRDPQLTAAANALNEERLPEADALLKRHLHRSPTDVAAIRLMAELAVRLGRNDDAVRLLLRCLEIAPGFREARENLALALYRSNQPERALAELERLLRDDAGNPVLRSLQAAVLCRVGEFAAGKSVYEQLLAEFPNDPGLWVSYGHTLNYEGATEAAVDAYRRGIAIDPAFGEAYWSLANLKTFRFNDDEIAAMRRQLERADLATEQRLQFEFALGKALEDAADYESSFRHYAEGNRLRLGMKPYSAQDNSVRCARARRTYTSDFFSARNGWGDPAPDPIFIVGLPRAGSTLLEQILSSHPLVEGTQELPEIISMTRALRRRDGGKAGGYHAVLAGLDAGAVRALGAEYLQRTRIQRKTSAPFFIDKMPNNFLHVGLILLALPNARIVDARRHPLACCVSNFKQHFARGQRFTYSLGDIGRYYHDYVRLMAHFDAVQPGRIHRVFHERLVDDTEAEIRRLLEYCGLPFDERCLRFHENERSVRTASSGQVRRPINRDGIDQWRNYEPWLGPLKDALGPVLDAYPAVPDFSPEP